MMVAGLLIRHALEGNLLCALRPVLGYGMEPWSHRWNLITPPPHLSKQGIVQEDLGDGAGREDGCLRAATEAADYRDQAGECVAACPFPALCSYLAALHLDIWLIRS